MRRDPRRRGALTRHALATVHGWIVYDWEVMEREFTRALALNPNAALTHVYYGLTLATMGRAADAEHEVEQAVALDPISVLNVNLVSLVYLILRRYERGIEEAEKALAPDPDFAPASWSLSLSLSQVGRHEEAIAAAERAVALSHRAPFCVTNLGRALGLGGRIPEARRLLGELQERSRRESVAPWSIALLLVVTGELDAAFSVFEKALAEDCAGLVFNLSTPAWDPLRGDPRFTAILRAVGYKGQYLLSVGAPPTPA
jgi:tetratricopeptide (TPR) repeat protein